MKKITLALAILMSLGLTACAKQAQDNSYKGEILFSQYEGGNLKLTIRKNNCERKDGEVESVTLTHNYDSNLPVGACVNVSDDGNGMKNVSRTVSRSWLSRTGVSQ